MDTILLVYAHDFLRRYLAEILETQGYRAIQARHTDDAQHHLRAGVKLILCEDKMATDMMQEGEKWGIPVIVTTTRTDMDGPAPADPTQNFLEIPFSVDELLVRIAATLGRTDS
jgi:DNA-binding NtrC family response regulator